MLRYHQGGSYLLEMAWGMEREVGSGTGCGVVLRAWADGCRGEEAGGCRTLWIARREGWADIAQLSGAPVREADAAYFFILSRVAL
jgi:hypothetical protein